MERYISILLGFVFIFLASCAVEKKKAVLVVTKGYWYRGVHYDANNKPTICTSAEVWGDESTCGLAHTEPTKWLDVRYYIVNNWLQIHPAVDPNKIPPWIDRHTWTPLDPNDFDESNPNHFHDDEVPLYVKCPGPGDWNRDGIVNLLDFVLLVHWWENP